MPAHGKSYWDKPAHRLQMVVPTGTNADACKWSILVAQSCAQMVIPTGYWDKSMLLQIMNPTGTSPCAGLQMVNPTETNPLRIGPCLQMVNPTGTNPWPVPANGKSYCVLLAQTRPLPAHGDSYWDKLPANGESYWNKRMSHAHTCKW